VGHSTPRPVTADLVAVIPPAPRGPHATPLPKLPPPTTPDGPPHRVLIVDDQPAIRHLCRLALAPDGLVCEEVGTGPDAIAAAARRSYDLVLLDYDLPGFNGQEVLRRLRLNPPGPNLKVVMFSGTATGDDLSLNMLGGADDFLTKPFSTVQLRARVKAALRLKAAQDRSDRLNRTLTAVNAELEAALADRTGELYHARGGLVLALVKLIEHRSTETGAHLMRLQRYCRVLAEAAADLPAFAPLIDPEFVRILEDAAPLHDIGKAALPDGILNKPGALTPDERATMQAHTTIGATTLRAVADSHPFALGFLQMAIDIARSHHERWDGTGYPDRLAGEEIPLAARLLAITDVYDALRAKRVYKAGMTHAAAVGLMTENTPGHFDPVLMTAFAACADRFDRVFREVGD
jgi:putative two-component system response regulator